MELFKKKIKRKKDNDIKNDKIIEMIIIYKIEGKNKIQLFGSKFIENNKNNCKIIIYDKELNIVEYLKINKKDKILKIKLKEIKLITDISEMFYNCESLITLPDISNWNTNNVTNVSSMFFDCKSLISLPDISNWNTNNITDMSYMFSGCRSLISLPNISNWNMLLI